MLENVRYLQTSLVRLWDLVAPIYSITIKKFRTFLVFSTTTSIREVMIINK